MVRDRKMYVAPTPFGLTHGTAHHQTLILPASTPVDERFERVGELLRVETEQLIVGYSFDLQTNVLSPDTAANPHAGREHHFCAYRMAGQGGDGVTMCVGRTHPNNSEGNEDE